MRGGAWSASPWEVEAAEAAARARRTAAPISRLTALATLHSRLRLRGAHEHWSSLCRAHSLLSIGTRQAPELAMRTALRTWRKRHRTAAAHLAIARLSSSRLFPAKSALRRLRSAATSRASARRHSLVLRLRSTGSSSRDTSSHLLSHPLPAPVAPPLAAAYRRWRRRHPEISRISAAAAAAELHFSRCVSFRERGECLRRLMGAAAVSAALRVAAVHASLARRRRDLDGAMRRWRGSARVEVAAAGLASLRERRRREWGFGRMREEAARASCAKELAARHRQRILLKAFEGLLRWER